jgi:1-acyl-sn-glycerol-3-phosphate acyltransferase
MIAVARAILKFAGFLWVSVLALADHYWNVRRKGGGLNARVDWCQKWALRYLDLLGVELERRGQPPEEGLLVCNHLSYLDIIVLSASRRQVFLSKREVKNWPIIGALASCAGTLFINRERRGDVAKLQSQFSEVVDAGLSITLFPEGTSSDGSKVLPFYSSLLEPAVKSKWPVTPAWLGYRLDEGSVADDVCYWRDMTFLPHFIKLLSKKKIYATVVFGSPVAAGLNRKELAAALHREVSALAVTGAGTERQLPELEDELLTAEGVSEVKQD